MHCPSDEVLNRFHDNELSVDERLAMVQHLETCDACAARISELNQWGEVIRSAPLPTPAMAMLVRWGQTTRATQDRSVRRLASWMTAAASVVLVVTLYSATSTQAQALPVIHEWETAVLGMDIESTSSDQVTAQFIITDLAQGGSGVKP